jgi:hypothetical protein
MAFYDLLEDQEPRYQRLWCRASKKQTPTAKYRKPEQTSAPQSGCAGPVSPEFARKWDKIIVRRSQAAGECTGDPEIRAVIY